MSDPNELYAMYAASKALLELDATLTAQQKADVLTQLTDDLLAAEEAAGIHWKPIAEVTVEATEDGSIQIGEQT